MDRRKFLTLAGSTAVLGATGCLSDDGAATPTESSPSTDESSPSGVGSGATTRSSPTGSDGRTTRDSTGTAERTSGRSTGTALDFDVTTPPSGECTATAPPEPSSGPRVPDPRVYPERPAETTPEAVRSFLEEYETAYRYNLVLADLVADDACVEYVEVNLDGSAVTAAENGVLGEVETFAAYQEVPCETVAGTDTQTPHPHADLFYLTGEYYVTDRFLVRNDVVHECWD